MRIPSRIAIWLAAGACLAALLLAGGKVSETVERTLTLGKHGIVAITNVNGSIRIAASENDQVFLLAVKTARDTDSLRATTIEIDESPGRIAVETRFPKRRLFGSGSSGASVAYDLRIPRNAKIRAESTNGSITIRNIRGDVRTETVNGSIKISNAGRTVNAVTVNGSLNVAYSDADEVGNNTLKTVNGSLQVWLPPDVNGAFQARTVNGSIRTDFPLIIRKSKYGRHQSINDQLGERGGTFLFVTVNGSIKIHKT